MKSKKFCYIKVKPRYKVKIDVEDLKRVSPYTWYVTKGTTGRLRVVATVRTAQGSKKVTLGKFLMKPPKGKQVYPRRFNEELDYCKSNLIVCTLKERQQLLPKKRIKTSSIYRGVSFVKKVKKWRAGIEVKGRAINLGNYATEDEAALAYNAAARKYFGPLAYQNPVGKKHLKRKK